MTLMARDGREALRLAREVTKLGRDAWTLLAD